MSFMATGVALASGALVSLVVAMQPLSQADGQGAPTGLWSTSFSAGHSAADCGKFRLGDNGFCVADDSRNGLEVGVRFQTSQELLITGVRVYRVDSGSVTGSLWDAGGSRLAKGKFSPSADSGWQDLSFADPVVIVPGSTYVASYFTPQTKYAFSYEYFAPSALTVGPVTALRSVDGRPNGVFCYDDAECGSFPVRGHRSTNYWVTPLWQDPGPGPSPTSTVTPTSTATVDRRSPRVTSASPAQGALWVRLRKPVKVMFSEAVRRVTLSSSSVRLLRKNGSKRVAARLTYDAASRRAVLHPRSPLRPATTYRVVVATSVRDTAGNRLDQVSTKAGFQSARWTFRTR